MFKKIGRNDPCPCGSGKKSKKCCFSKREPRSRSITVDMGEPTPINGLMLNTLTGDVNFLKDGQMVKPILSEIETSYKRIKKEKTINSIPLSPNRLTIYPNRALEVFDSLVAIDTNTQSIRDNIVSVSCILIGNPSKVGNNTEVRIFYKKCLEFWNIKEKPENIAWMTFIVGILNSLNYNQERKIGIIVDSELDNIPKYNLRKCPIYSDFYLPDNMQFIYASSDVGKDYIGNKMLSIADKEASDLLNYLKNENNTENVIMVNNKPYTHIRNWEAIESKG